MNGRLMSRLVGGCVTLASAFGTTAALGQSALAPSAPTTAAPENATGTGDIVVTARKRSEIAIDVPSSITAIPQELLIERGATSLQEISNYVPGLTIGGGFGSNTVVIRGITTGASGGSPTSGVVVDGTPTGSSSSFAVGSGNQLDLDPSDIQRVEVLRGPQGTLYGASTLGGLVSYVTRRASLTDYHVSAGGEVAGTEGGAMSFTGRGALDIPLVRDHVGLRASGFYERKGGYIDDGLTSAKNVNSADRYGGRLDLNIVPTEGISIDIWGAVQRTRREAEDFIVTNALGQPRDGALQYNEYRLDARRQNFEMLYGSLAADLGFADLTYLGSYQHAHTILPSNFSNNGLVGTLAVIGQYGLGPVFPTPFAVDVDIDVDLRKVTQEVRLASKQKGPVTWIVGGFYTWEHAPYGQAVVGYTTAGAVVPTLNPAANFDLDTRYEELAAFGNVTWAITEQLAVTGGIRVGENRQTYEQLTSGPSLPGLNFLLGEIYGPAATLPPATVPTHSRETVNTYLADAQYKFSRNAQAYFRFATGFRPGGPNIQGVNTAPTFKSDSVDSYELGLKGQTTDRKIYGEIALYYIKWNDIQVTASSSGISYRTNGGKASSRGVEATLNLTPYRGLKFANVFAYNDAHLDEDAPAVGGIKGDTLPFSPKYTLTSSLDYQWALSGELNAFAGATGRLVGKRHVSFPNYAAVPDLILANYGMADLRAGVRTTRWEVSAFVRNLTDKRAELSGRTTVGINEVQIARPRTFGVQASVNY